MYHRRTIYEGLHGTDWDSDPVLSALNDYHGGFSLEDAEELGIAPLLAAAIPMATKLVGGMLSGGKGGGEGAAAGGLDMGSILGALGQSAAAAGGDGGLSLDSLKSTVSNLLREIPSPIRDQVQSALAEANAQKGSERNAVTNMTQQISAEFMPQIMAALSALKLQQNQTDATSEHRGIVKADARWAQNEDVHQRILDRLDALTSAVKQGFKGQPIMVRSPRRIDVLGGRRLLSGRLLANG